MAAPSIFLSHSTKDLAFVQRLEADLQQTGATVYRISGDQGGDFQERINEALSACQYVVLVLTPDALASPWVKQEMNAANVLKNQGYIKDILPIQARRVDTNKIPVLWRVYNIFDASGEYATGRNGLLRALGLSIPAPDAAQPNVHAARRSGLPATARQPVFVSYTSKDGDFCRSFVEALKALGVDVWHDKKSLSAGTEWYAAVQREIEAREVFLILLTPTAWESQWVQAELRLAMALRRRIVPVFLEPTPVSGFIITYQSVNVAHMKPDAAAKRVVADLGW